MTFGVVIAELMATNQEMLVEKIRTLNYTMKRGKK